MTETEPTEDRKEVDCKNKCGQTVEAFWHRDSNQWCYLDKGYCDTCRNKQRAEELRIWRSKSAGLTEAEAALTLDNFVADEGNKAALSACKRMAMGDSINLFLCGKAGRGKTHLAVGVLNELSKSNPVRFVPVTRWLLEIRSRLSDGGEERGVRKALEMRALVLDDFGASKATEWSLSFLDCVIDEWYRQRKKGLIITSNFTLKQISENMSDRIASRLKELCEIYELKGKDYRVGGKK